MPLSIIAALAAGEARNAISARPASGSSDVVTMPAENTVIRNRKHFADLLEADLGVTARHHTGDRLGRDFPGPVLDRVGDTEPLKHFGRDVDAAGAVGISDRFRREQRAPDRVGGADVRLRRARSHRDADRRFHEIDAAVGDHLALLDKVAERMAHHDQYIGGFAALQSGRDRIDGGPHRWPIRRQHLVAGQAFEFRNQRVEGCGKATRDHHPDLGGTCRASQQQRASHDEHKHTKVCGFQSHDRCSSGGDS